MNYFGCLVVAFLIASSVIAQSNSDVSDPEVVDTTERPVHDERFNGHLAYYVTLSKITFATLREATNALHDIREGTKSFLEFAKDLSIDNAKHGRQNSALQNGDLGLLTYDLLDEELAEVAFDIRNPIAKSAQDLLGPVCSRNGCSILAVFSRYRRSFFSDAWWEAEQYARDHDISFAELLQQLGTDDITHVAAAVWPHEHIVFKKLKVRQLKADVKRLNEVDPSTVLDSPVIRGKKDLTAHKALMKRREKIFENVDATVKEEHGEIYAMSIPQMIQHGFITQEKLDEIDRAIAEEEADEKLALRKEYVVVGDGKKITPAAKGAKHVDESAPVLCGLKPPVDESECGGEADVVHTVLGGEEEPLADLSEF